MKEFIVSDTPTAKFLFKDNLTITFEASGTNNFDMVTFENINKNNIKNLAISFPKKRFTTICGISGSGKSSLLGELFGISNQNMLEYGFKKVIYLSQRGLRVNIGTDVGDILKLNSVLAKLFSEKSGLPAQYFMPGSKAGKCACCKGVGMINQGEETFELCPQCRGLRYDVNVLECKYFGMNIAEIRTSDLSSLRDKPPHALLNNMAVICDDLGIGYLSIERMAKTLSNGELQRAILARALNQHEKDVLYLLDEPSKGLHPQDIIKLVHVLRNLTAEGNTIVAVEHNPMAIIQSDYTIELGPGSGERGGQVVYCGMPTKMKGTPTANAIQEISTYTPQIASRVEFDSLYHYVLGDERICLEAHAINYLSNQKGADLLFAAAKVVNDVYLCNAAPNMPIDLQKETGDWEFHTPILSTVDLAKPSFKTNTSIAHITGLSRRIGYLFASKEKSALPLKQLIFNSDAQEGKCLRCRGEGKVDRLPDTLFMAGDRLTSACRKFLTNSTNFASIVHSMQELFGFNLKNDYQKLSQDEKFILFNGYDRLVNGAQWKGIIENALQNKKYYPDKNISNLFNHSTNEVLCPFCRGDLLISPYKDIELYGLTYAEWLKKPILDLYRQINKIDIKNETFLIIKTLCEFDLGHISLLDNILSFPKEIQGIIKIISLFYNNIYGSIIVLDGISDISEKYMMYMKSVMNKLRITNTIACF